MDRKDLCPNTPEGETIDDLGCHPQANIALEGVNFEIGTASLTDDSHAILDSIINILKQFPDLKLEVAGHTDDTGSAARNTSLSASRAASVKTYLAEHGIQEERIDSKGYGSDEPIASNTTDAGRAANRRVELRRK